MQPHDERTERHGVKCLTKGFDDVKFEIEFHDTNCTYAPLIEQERKGAKLSVKKKMIQQPVLRLTRNSDARWDSRRS